MARNELCPLCRKSAERVLQLRFRAKMKLPSEPIIRFCAADNFLFVAAGSQQNYDEYYATVINDSYHAEMGGAHARSPIVIEQKRQFLRQPEKLYREPILMIEAVLVAVLMLILLKVNIPILGQIFAPTLPSSIH